MKLFKKQHYDKVFNQRELTVYDYQKQIAEAQDKIAALQAKCEHRETEVVMYMWRPGAMQPQRVCQSCSHVSEASDEETIKLWTQWVENQAKAMTSFSNYGEEE